MPKREHLSCSTPESPEKQSKAKLKKGVILRDIAGERWKISNHIGAGAFGCIYTVVNQSTGVECVAKLEEFTNGPLFVEINCYLRIAKPEMIQRWKDEHKLQDLGMPHYIASGSHVYKGHKHRFLILPKFERDLEFAIQNKIPSLKTVLIIAQQIIDILEYIHHKGYVHSDIKASNILISESDQSVSKSGRPLRSCRKRTESQSRKGLRPKKYINYSESEEMNSKKNQIYLLDYGLATKFLWSDGRHKQFTEDLRRAHMGTVLFCSRDAHMGIQSRRSDLESLGYNLVYWLTGKLPWIQDEDPNIVKRRKQKYFSKPERLLQICFGHTPTFLLHYFKYLQTLQFEDKPNYDWLRKLFENAMKEYGFKDCNLNFDTETNDWSEENHDNELHVNISFMPPKSNVFVKPLLRKKTKNKKEKLNMNWSRILIDNPEIIMKQARDKEKQEEFQRNNVLNLDLEALNPTKAMRQIYQKCRDRFLNEEYNSDDKSSTIAGYTPAMVELSRNIENRQQDVEGSGFRNSKSLQRASKRKRFGLIKKLSHVTCKKMKQDSKLKELPINGDDMTIKTAGIDLNKKGKLNGNQNTLNLIKRKKRWSLTRTSPRKTRSGRLNLNPQNNVMMNGPSNRTYSLRG